MYSEAGSSRQLRAPLLFAIQISVARRLYLWVATSIVSCRIVSLQLKANLSLWR